MVAVVTRWTNTAAFTSVPTDFADWGTTYTSGDGQANVHIFWKRLTGADSGTYTWSWTAGSNDWSHAHVFCFSGVASTGNPIEDVNAWSGTAGSFGSTSLTTVTIPGLVWSSYNDSNGTHTPPTGFNEVIDFDSGSGAYLIATSAGTQTASGGSVTSSSPAAAVLIALKAEGAGSPVGFRSTAFHPGRGPSRTARFFKTPRAFAAPTLTAVQTGTTAVGLAASGTAAKVAWVSGTCSMGVATTGGAAKRAVETGSAAAGLAAGGAAGKRAPRFGVAAMGFASTGTAAKKTPVVGLAVVGVAGAGAARKVASASGVSVSGLALTGTAAKKTVESGTAILGLVGMGAAVKIGSASGRSTLGMASIHSGLIVRAVSGVCTLGLGSASWPSKTAVQGGVSTIGDLTVATAAKRTISIGQCGMGLLLYGSSAKRAGGAGVSALGLLSTGVVVKSAAERGIVTIGLLGTYLAVVTEPPVTPPERTFVVASEDRTIRTMDDRTLVVTAETRSTEV